MAVYFHYSVLLLEYLLSNVFYILELYTFRYTFDITHIAEVIAIHNV